MSFTAPIEIDTEIARLLMAEAKPEAEVARQNRYATSDDSYSRHFFDQAKLDAAQAELDKLREQRAEVEALYTGWQRYFHVTNVNGHVHTSMSCSSCFPDTQFAWRTDLSGLTEEEVVEREAYNACTVCMPIAPAEQKAARERYNREQRDAKAAEKQAKKDEKLRKAAERAVKFLAKVDAQVVKSFGSWDALWAEYSLYGNDGKKSLYDATFDMPSQVGDYLYDEMAQREHERGSGFRHMKDPKAIIEEARTKGLLD